MLFYVLTTNIDLWCDGEWSDPSETRRKRDRTRGDLFSPWLWLNPLANASHAFLRAFVLLLTADLHSADFKGYIWRYVCWKVNIELEIEIKSTAKNEWPQFVIKHETPRPLLSPSKQVKPDLWMSVTCK